MEDSSVVPEAGLILFGIILFIALTYMCSFALFFKNQDLIFCIGLHLFEARSVRPKAINNIQDSSMSMCISNNGYFSNTLDHIRC